MKTKGSLKLIREINSSIIIDLLKDKGPLSKYEISKHTGLSAPSVTNIVNDLIKIGIVKEVGMGESIGGRPPLLLDLNLEGGFIIGVDISSDDITSIVVDFVGNIVSKSVTTMDADDSEFIIFDKIISTISDSIEKTGKDRSLFIGMGIGVSGDVDSEKGIILHASRLKWNNVPLKSIIENSFHIPTFINENVRLLSFAEKWFGAGKNHENIICIRVGDDIGAGIILGGELFGGSSGKAGVNLSHMTIDPNGLKCDCGSNGCLQTLISSNAIILRARELLKKYKDSVLTQYTEMKNRENSKLLTVKVIADAAKAGDGASLKIMDETGKYLGIAISNLVNFFDPELVIIGGGIAESGQVLFTPIMKHMQNYIKLHNPSLKIVPSVLGADSYAIGAAAIVLHQIFSTPKRFITKLKLP
ncbi:MAG: ROK family protein [Clostridiaceae bacterium]